MRRASNSCGAIGYRIRLLTEKLMVQAHPGTKILILSAFFVYQLLGMVNHYITLLLEALQT